MQKHDHSNLPRCSFIRASHARAPLRISFNMLAFVLSYHQVSPAFLDFIFPFGKQIGAQYNDINGVRNESRLFEKQTSPAIDALCRSGREIRMCYNLRSVEVSPKQTPLPWSIRHTAVYHSIDLVTGHVVWVNIKGNQVLEKRVEADSTIAKLAASRDSSLAASLMTHLVFAEWAGEGWRSYINVLESKVQNETTRTIATPVEEPTSGVYSTRSVVTSEKPTILPNSTKCNSVSDETTKPAEFNEGKLALRHQPVRNDLKTGTNFEPNSLEQDGSLIKFSFDNLQDAQWLEEKIDESVLVLSLNLVTLKGLREIYVDYSRQPPTVAMDSFFQTANDDISTFSQQIINIEQDLGTQVMRSKSLLRKLHERKALVTDGQTSLFADSLLIEYS
jgi:hypothetical protein